MIRAIHHRAKLPGGAGRIDHRIRVRRWHRARREIWLSYARASVFGISELHARISIHAKRGDRRHVQWPVVGANGLIVDRNGIKARRSLGNKFGARHRGNAFEGQDRSPVRLAVDVGGRNQDITAPNAVGVARRIEHIFREDPIAKRVGLVHLREIATRDGRGDHVLRDGGRVIDFFVDLAIVVRDFVGLHHDPGGNGNDADHQHQFNERNASLVGHRRAHVREVRIPPRCAACQFGCIKRPAVLPCRRRAPVISMR